MESEYEKRVESKKKDEKIEVILNLTGQCYEGSKCPMYWKPT
ncbi:MAG: hypothetical protein ACETWM_09780 [Candidatus Lokiarchaeia archaeon]